MTSKTPNYQRWIKQDIQNKYQIKEDLSTNPVLQKILEGKLHVKEDKYIQG